MMLVAKPKISGSHSISLASPLHHSAEVHQSKSMDYDPIMNERLLLWSMNIIESDPLSSNSSDTRIPIARVFIVCNRSHDCQSVIMDGC